MCVLLPCNSCDFGAGGIRSARSGIISRTKDESKQRTQPTHDDNSRTPTRVHIGGLRVPSMLYKPYSPTWLKPMGKFTQGEMLLMLLNIQKGLMPTHVTHDLDLGNSSYSKEKTEQKNKFNLINYFQKSICRGYLTDAFRKGMFTVENSYRREFHTGMTS